MMPTIQNVMRDELISTGNFFHIFMIKTNIYVLLV